MHQKNAEVAQQATALLAAGKDRIKSVSDSAQAKISDLKAHFQELVASVSKLLQPIAPPVRLHRPNSVPKTSSVGVKFSPSHPIEPALIEYDIHLGLSQTIDQFTLSSAVAQKVQSYEETFYQELQGDRICSKGSSCLTPAGHLNFYFIQRENKFPLTLYLFFPPRNNFFLTFLRPFGLDLTSWEHYRGHCKVTSQKMIAHFFKHLTSAHTLRWEWAEIDCIRQNIETIDQYKKKWHEVKDKEEAERNKDLKPIGKKIIPISPVGKLALTNQMSKTAPPGPSHQKMTDSPTERYQQHLAAQEHLRIAQSAASAAASANPFSRAEFSEADLIEMAKRQSLMETYHSEASSSSSSSSSAMLYGSGRISPIDSSSSTAATPSIPSDAPWYKSGINSSMSSSSAAAAAATPSSLSGRTVFAPRLYGPGISSSSSAAAATSSSSSMGTLSDTARIAKKILCEEPSSEEEQIEMPQISEDLNAFASVLISSQAETEAASRAAPPKVSSYYDTEEVMVQQAMQLSLGAEPNDEGWVHLA
jgi:hypothetical protein